MKASDIYGSSVFGGETTQADTNPNQSTVSAGAANDAAKKKGSLGSGGLAVLVLVGILVGAKFALER